MGLHFSRIWERMFGKKEMRILMVGLDAAGKVSHFRLHYFNFYTMTLYSTFITDYYSIQIETW